MQLETLLYLYTLLYCIFLLSTNSTALLLAACYCPWAQCCACCKPGRAAWSISWKKSTTEKETLFLTRMESCIGEAEAKVGEPDRSIMYEAFGAPMCSFPQDQEQWQTVFVVGLRHHLGIYRGKMVMGCVAISELIGENKWTGADDVRTWSREWAPSN